MLQAKDVLHSKGIDCSLRVVIVTTKVINLNITFMVVTRDNFDVLVLLSNTGVIFFSSYTLAL